MKIDKTKLLIAIGSLMKVESIAECSHPIGAFCNTFDLHKAMIDLKNQLSVFFRVAVLHRSYCMTREHQTNRPQTNQRRHEEEKQREIIAKLERTPINTQQNKDQIDKNSSGSNDKQ